MGMVGRALGLELSQPPLTRADLRIAELADAMLEKAEKAARAKTEDTEATTKAPPAGEVGATGTVNYLGHLRAENNPRLRDQSAYGRQETWGEYEKMVRTDPDVVKGLEMVAGPIRSAKVEVEPGEDDELGLRIADFVKDNLEDWLEPTWAEFASQAVKMPLSNGFGLWEHVYGLRADERVPGGQAWYLRKLAERLPQSLDFNAWVEKDGELSVVRQQAVVSGVFQSRIEIPAEKLLLISWGRSGNNYAGYPQTRSAWRIVETRAEILRILGIGIEREMLGIPLASIDKDAKLQKAQLDDLMTTMQRLVAHESAALVGLPGVKLEWWCSPAANKGHAMEMYERLGLVVLRLFFAEQSFLGTSDTGSRAVGEIHADAKAEFIEGVTSNIEAALNGVGARPYTGLVRKIVGPNWGEQRRYPKVKLVLRRVQMPANEFATALKTLTDAGAIVLTEADENPLRDRLGMAPLDAAERAAELERKEAMRATIAGQMAQAKPDGEDEEDGDEDGEETEAPLEDEPGGEPVEEEPSSGEGAPAAARKLADVPVPSRPLRPSERVLNLADIGRFFESSREQFEAMVKPIVDTMIRDAIPDIQEAMKDGNPAELQGLNLDAKLLAKAVEVFVEGARAFGYRQARLEGASSSPALPAFTVAMANRVARAYQLKEPDELEPDVVDNLVKAQTALITERIRTRTKQALWDEAVNAVRTGKNADSAVDAVLRQLEEAKTLRSDAGVVLSRSFSMGREQYIQQEADNIEHLELSSALEESTCPQCRALDGREFPVNSEAHREFTPPLSQCDGRNNCRCVLIPVYRRS
jgi:hypothetical protein